MKEKFELRATSNPDEKGYIPSQFYSSEGLYEIIYALENTNDPCFSKEFQGTLLWATRKEGTVQIDEKLMEKLKMTAEHCFTIKQLSEEDYTSVIERINKLKEKYKI